MALLEETELVKLQVEAARMHIQTTTKTCGSINKHKNCQKLIKFLKIKKELLSANMKKKQKATKIQMKVEEALS